MAFRYPLQPILRLRQSVERQEEQRLFAIAATVTALRAQIEQWENTRKEMRRISAEELMAGSAGAVLQFATLSEANAAEAQAKLQSRLVEAEQQRLVQLGVYQEARQKREIFERLRDRQKETYDRMMARKEQESADESFLIQFVVKPKE